MLDLMENGIIDLGGSGDQLLEIEYTNNKGEFKEAIFRLPESCIHSIASGKILHENDHSILQYISDETFDIHLPDRCLDLIEVRLGPGVSMTDIFA